MAKPATDARLAAAANGFTEVVARGDSHIITKNPTTGKCCYGGRVGGGWHYGAGLETDTAWLPGTAPWNWQMVKALYNVFALSNFKDGQIIKWLDPGSGQYVTFQPMALQWTNSLDQIQQISMPQSVAAQASDDVLYWPAAYGSGRNFRYQATPLRLNKQLIIDSPSALPSTSYDTLELNFIISVSSGVNIIVDEAAWDKKTQKDTTKAFAFQLPGGAILWSFAAPRAWDSVGNETAGSMRLKRSGSRLYVSVRFPKAWVDSAVFPIMLDPSLDYQVGAGADDGYWKGSSTFSNSYSQTPMSQWDTSSGLTYSFVRFTGVTIPDGATITTSYLSFYTGNVSDTPQPGKIYFEKAASPNAVSSHADGDGRTLTTAYISFTHPGSGTWFNSDSINTIIAELIGDNSYAAGAAMQMIAKFVSFESGYALVYSYDGWAARAPKLHIEYTEAVAGGSLVIPSHRRQFQTLSVR